MRKESGLKSAATSATEASVSRRDGHQLDVADPSGAGERFWDRRDPAHLDQAPHRGQRRWADAVNLEADLLAKYTERVGCGHKRPGGGTPPPMAGIDAAWLAEHGWPSVEA